MLLVALLGSTLAIADPGVGPMIGDPPPPPPLPGRARVAQVGTKGAVKPGEARRAIESMQSQLDYCYAHERARGVTTEGEAVLRVRLPGGDAKAEVEVVEDPVDSERMQTCFTSRLRRAPFPERAEASTVKVTFALEEVGREK